MELNDGNLQTLSVYLLQTLSPDADVRKPGSDFFPLVIFIPIIIFVFSSAEKFLESIEGNKNYPLLLLHLVNKQDIDLSIRTSGAIVFKNFVKRNWEIVSYQSFIAVLFFMFKFFQSDDQTNRIHDEDRLQVKAYIVDLMLGSPRNIQKQLSDAISIIGKSDFPNKWQDLLSKLDEKCKTGISAML
jgi:exportin-2 (importin alpha re-exporter)